MFRYLGGILLVQVVTLALFWVNRQAGIEDLMLRAAFPSLIVAGVTALWLSTLGRMDAERRNAALRESHASEREKLHRKIERTRSEVLQQAHVDKALLQEQAFAEREQLVLQTHRQLLQRERSISRRANLKVGLAFMAVTGLGVLMLITEMMTLGLLTITTAGGALGGYVLRWRQSRQALDRLSGAGDVGATASSAGPADASRDGTPSSDAPVRGPRRQASGNAGDSGKPLPAIEGELVRRGLPKSR